MLCILLLSSLWFMFLICWVETINVWFFLSMLFQDRPSYHWGQRVFSDDSGLLIYMLNRVDAHMPRDMN